MRSLALLEMEVWTPTKCPRRLLADDCWIDQPDKRPSMEEIVTKLEVICHVPAVFTFKKSIFTGYLKVSLHDIFMCSTYRRVIKANPSH